MSTADEQIRVSATVKNELEHRRRGDESFNDVLERLLSDDRDLFAGFGAFEGTDRGAAIRRTHEQGTEESSERIERVAESRRDE
jgi:predicted CopG family antitoxin